MNDRLRFALPSAALTFVSQFPSIAAAQVQSAASAASHPPKDDGKVIDPTLFIAVVIALIVGFLVGRISVRSSAAA